MRSPVGVIGGSGLYELMDDLEIVQVETPFGPTSDSFTVAHLDERDVVFVPRHGRRHQWPPHRVPYQANLWALHDLGVRQVIATYAVGSLDPEIGPGTLVVPDQVIDRTSQRPTTMWDHLAVHVPFAEPYCAISRWSAIAAAATQGWPAVDGGTMAVIEGPRFSSRAESLAHAATGADLINMTAMPEAALARELALCLVPLALVTDHDAGSEGHDGSVTMAEVLSVFEASTTKLTEVVLALAAQLPLDRSCACMTALVGTPAEGLA